MIANVHIDYQSPENFRNAAMNLADDVGIGRSNIESMSIDLSSGLETCLVKVIKVMVIDVDIYERNFSDV